MRPVHPHSSSSLKTKSLKSPEQLMQDAFALYNAQKFPETIAACKKILEIVQAGNTAESAALLWIKTKQDDAKGWNILGSILTNNKKFNDAAQALSIAQKLDPKLVEIYINLAILNRQIGFLTEARAYYDQALTLDPNHRRARTNRINILLNMGLWDETKQELDIALNKYRNDPAILAIAGRYYRAIGDIEQSVAYLEKAHKQDPNNIRILLNLTGVMSKNKTDKAILKPLWVKLSALIEASPDKALFQSDYKYVQKLLAIVNRDLLSETDLILPTRHLDLVTESEQDIDVTIIDESRRLYRLRNHVCHSEEWVIYNDKHLFPNLMVTGTSGQVIYDEIDSVYLNRADIDHLHLDGSYILLGGAENYYHWWIDFLPRIGILREFPELKDHKILILNSLNSDQLATLAKVGISEDRLVKIRRNYMITCDELIVPSLTGRRLSPSGTPEWMQPMVNDWAIHWLREEFADWLVPIPNMPKRIFISRTNARFRRCINEAEIYAIAQRYGFMTLENEHMSYQEQMAVYAGAEIVMGPHGAGFTNMLFAPETATAIEMFPKRRAASFYREMCEQIGQRYIKFDGAITRLQPEKWADFGDFYIDPVEAERVLASL
jgi:tetratricopeptide (TPR) repeat protein